MDLPSPEALALISVVLLLTCIALGIMLWSVKRHRDPHIHIDCDAALDDLVPSLAGLTHGMEAEGNQVEILENGPFFDALIADISGAAKSVHFETFLWKDGRLGKRLTDALCERARAGVAVRVVIDANGCKGMGKEAESCLEEAGAKLARYHPWKLRNIGVMNKRDHRKLAILDGRTAYVGGHCIVDEWLGDGNAKDSYRDISVRLRGPAVHQVQSAFSENWIEITGQLFAGEDYFPKLEPAGDMRVHSACVTADGSAPAVKILHHFVICTARRRLWIQNPYFLPEPEAIEAFGKAVARGVDVRVMVPTAEASDMPMVQQAAHRNFARLLDAGVRIFEFPVTLLHQKVMTVDGVWSAVGSTNFDDRAFEINDEITLGIHSEEFAREIEAIFERDMKRCKELNAADWARRGILRRAREHFFYTWNELM